MKEKIIIKKLGINGEGIGYINKKICFVEGALPDEEVEIEIIEQKPKYYKGRIKKIIKASPYRVKVICKEDKECLGCRLMHLNYLQHLYVKKRWILDAISKYCHEVNGKVVQDVVEAKNRLHYRHVVRLPIVYFNKQLHVGIYQRESHYLTLMEDCYIQNELINQTLKKVLDIFNKYKLRDFHDKFKTGLRFIEMREMNEKIAIVIICGKDGIDKKVIDEISQIKEVVSVYYSVNTAKYQDFKLQGYKKVYGHSSLSVNLFDQRLTCSMKSDFPLNIEMEEKKIEIVKSLIDDEKKIISLNSGIGALELSLDNQITAIDANRDHIHDAAKNMNFVEKDNVSWVLGDVNKEVVKYCKKNHYDIMIINAIQRGLSDEIKESLVKSSIKEFIYITPHYSTMAKEIEELSPYFKVETIVPLDYEPYTSEVLTILKMKKKK